MKGKRERKDNRVSLPVSEDYTIFHALLETMTKKKEMDSRRHKLLSNTTRLMNLAASLLAASAMIILALGIYAH